MLFGKEVTANDGSSRIVRGFLLLPKVLPVNSNEMDKISNGGEGVTKWRMFGPTRLVQSLRFAEGREYWIDSHWLD